MAVLPKRNPLVPWYIGMVLVLISVGIVAWQMFATGCCAPPIAIVLVLIALPVIYLALMYLTLKNQP